MIIPLEDRWGILSVLEFEHGAKKALLSLHRKNLLKYGDTAPGEQEEFISETASVYAASCLRQGKEFFRHAEAASWLAKPLLLYYGMLSAVKAALVFEFPDYFLDHKNLKHGIGAGARAKSKIDFQTEYVEVQKLGVFPKGRAAFEQEGFAEGTRIVIGEMLLRMPEVDATYRYVLSRHEEPLGCIKIFGNPLFRDPKDRRVRIGFHLPPALYGIVKDRLPASVVNNAEIAEIEIDGEKRVSFRSKESWLDDAAASEALPRSLAQTLDNNFALILPLEKGGKLYELSELELIYLVVFYLSNLARYQPHLWLDLLAGTEDLSVLLCHEILRTCENKFLALLRNELNYAGLLPLVESFRALAPQEASQPVATVGSTPKG